MRDCVLLGASIITYKIAVYNGGSTKKIKREYLGILDIQADLLGIFKNYQGVSGIEGPVGTFVERR